MRKPNSPIYALVKLYISTPNYLVPMIIRLSKNIFSTGVVLLCLTLFTIFIVPVFPSGTIKYLYPACNTLIFFAAALSLQKNQILLFRAAIAISTVLWISYFANLLGLVITTRCLQFFFFLYLVIALIRQVASSSVVSRKVIVDAITGYFLLGFVLFTMVLGFSLILTNAYNLKVVPDSDNLEPLHEYIYYAFITYTTTGYGDIVPVHPATKSLAILIGVSGQLYVATIIAMLVGKYAGEKN
jgi:voltage-gated potassium channel